MYRTSKVAWTKLAVIVLAAGILSLTPTICSATPGAGASTVSRRQNVKNMQEALRDKGYYKGKVDGIEGPHTRSAIRQYQKAEGLRATGRLDAQTAGKLGVNQESAGAEFKSAGHQVGEGSEAAGHQMKKGKPLAAGKEFGEGVGRFGKDVGKGVKKAVKHGTDTSTAPQK